MSPFHFRDRALVGRLLKGEEDAFASFFDSHFPGLYRFALSRLREEGAAEEVAQATLCKAIRKLSTYRGEASLFAWLCTFCRHEIHAHLRAAQRQPEAVGFIDDLPEIRAVLESFGADVSQGGFAGGAIGGRGPEMDLRRKELARFVQTALDHLPPHYGQALEWKYLEELSVKEIAQRLDLAPKAAESLLGRARAAFRETFDLLRGPDLLPKNGGAR